MKKYLFGLLGFALLGGAPLLAQAPPPPAGVIIDGAPHGVCCEGGSCTPTKTVCVPEHYVKKTVKREYNCTSEPICLCYFRGLFKGCDCDKGHCERPYTRRYLVLKIHRCEEDATKCVPQEVPACGHGHGPAHSFASPYAGVVTLSVAPPGMAPATTVPPMPPVDGKNGPAAR